jgi:hypothetical protein
MRIAEITPSDALVLNFIIFMIPDMRNKIFVRSFIIWDIKLCAPVKVNPCFSGTYRLHLHGRRLNQAGNQHEASSIACCLIHAGFLLGLLFNHEDGGVMFLRNRS